MMMWHHVLARSLGCLAETALASGSVRSAVQAAAEGSPEADGYTNKEGQAAATLRMRVQNIQLLGGGNKDSQGSNSGNVTNTGMTTAPVIRAEATSTALPVDDLPF